MPPSTKTQQLSLPSIMVADDVEAEHDSAAQRRALRAARQTVRIELPANFGRPGSALVPGLLPGTSTALPLPESELTGRGLPIKRYAPWALAGLLLVAALLLLVMRPRSGSLVVTALGAGHRAVESVQIFVDGKALCDSSPCRISGLSAGAHQLRATAPGMASEELTVEISAGEEAATNIELRSRMPEGAELAEGARASAVPEGEKQPARRDKVVVTIQLSPESEGASVTLDDAFLLDFPAELELEPRTTHTLTATKPGYQDYTLQLELGDEREQQIEVALTPLEGPRPRARTRPATAGASAQATTARKSATPVSRPQSPQADPTQGLLNISSTPPSQIILNGRPLGSTPKTAVVVPGDSLQTIVFVHPKMGRRRAQKFVPAGKERTVSIRF
jgi:serine/threonine-protein kinase